MTTVHIKHCGSWFNGNVADFREKFGNVDGITITNEPFETPEGGEKPFDVTINGKLVWSRVANAVPEMPEALVGKPLVFKENKWWGAAQEDGIAYMEACINAAKA